MTSSKWVDTLICHTTMRRNPINFLYNTGHVTLWCVEVGHVTNASEHWRLKSSMSIHFVMFGGTFARVLAILRQECSRIQWRNRDATSGYLKMDFVHLMTDSDSKRNEVYGMNWSRFCVCLHQCIDPGHWDNLWSIYRYPYFTLNHNFVWMYLLISIFYTGLQSCLTIFSLISWLTLWFAYYSMLIWTH